MNRFDMTYFYGPPAEQVVRPEVLGDILASGMTLLPLFADTKTNRETLRLLAELDGNARANVFDPRFRELYLSEDAAAVDGVVKVVVEDYRGGKTNALVFLVGQCMRASKGKGNPNILREMLEKALNG